MKIACWNVNSIRVRQEILEDFLSRENPDILMLQELKCQEPQMPNFDALSYNIVGSYQKTYNGVAIFSKYPIDEVKTDFDGNPDPEQARYIEISCITEIGYCRFICVYVPNGGEIGSDKFSYKLKFYDALTKYVQKLGHNDELLFVSGDYNVAPNDIDVYDPSGLREHVCFTLLEREKLYKLKNECRLLDAYRLLYPLKSEFTWWDYRGGGFSHNKGMRIDHILLNPFAANMLKDCYIDLTAREKPKTSDHAPIIATFI